MTKDGCRINHLHFMDDLKLFAKNEKEIDSLVQTVRIFSDNIGTKFGLEKCAGMTMKRGKRVHSDGITLPGGTQLRALGEEESILVCLKQITYCTRNRKRGLRKSM